MLGCCTDTQSRPFPDSFIMNFIFISSELLLLAEILLEQKPFLEGALQSWMRQAGRSSPVEPPGWLQRAAGKFWGLELCSSLKDGSQTCLHSSKTAERG